MPIEQAHPCPCGGSNDYCGCQDLHPAPRLISAEALLGWMTHHHLPLQIFREEEGGWVVVDASNDTVMASGETVFDALKQAHSKEESDV